MAFIIVKFHQKYHSKYGEKGNNSKETQSIWVKIASRTLFGWESQNTSPWKLHHFNSKETFLSRLKIKLAASPLHWMTKVSASNGPTKNPIMYPSKCRRIGMLWWWFHCFPIINRGSVIIIAEMKKAQSRHFYFDNRQNICTQKFETSKHSQ